MKKVIKDIFSKLMFNILKNYLKFILKLLAGTSASQNLQFKEQSGNQNLDDNADEILRHLKLKSVNRLVMGHFNINSLLNKFDSLKLLVKNSLNVFMISGTKLDKTFPEGQRLIDGFTPPYRMVRNTNGGGIALYVREYIPSRQISFKNYDKDIEHLFVEINLHRKKWLISCSYNSHLQFIDRRLAHMGKGLDSLSSKYFDFILMGDFNADSSNNFVDSFFRSYSLKSLIKTPASFKNPDNSTCIDLILTSRQKSFQNSNIIETELSDFHKLTVTVLKVTFRNCSPSNLYIVILRISLTNSFAQNS